MASAQPVSLAPWAPACVDEHHCVTCSDEGIPMAVCTVDERQGLARCESEDGAAEVATDLVAPVACGDILLVHAGVALANLGAPVRS